MAKSQLIRFAVGSATAPFSCVWRIRVHKNEVYVGQSKAAMGTMKLSLHSGGVWVFAATTESGASFANGNRRAKTWAQPEPHVSGVTRGPSILVPHTSMGARLLPPDENPDGVLWRPAPAKGEMVEFSMYFVAPGRERRWNREEFELASVALANGTLVVLLAANRPLGTGFGSTNEALLRDNVFTLTGGDGRAYGSLLRIFESPDAFKIPMLVDLPVPVRHESMNSLRGELGRRTKGAKEVMEMVDSVAALADCLRRSGSGVVALDGKDGVGKSFVAKELGSALDWPILELDTFLTPNQGTYVDHIRYPELAEALSLAARPVLVEGVCVLKVLERLGVAADFLVYVKRTSKSGHWLDEEVLASDLPVEELVASENQELAEFGRLSPCPTENVVGIPSVTEEIIRYHYTHRPLQRANAVLLNVAPTA